MAAAEHPLHLPPRARAQPQWGDHEQTGREHADDRRDECVQNMGGLRTTCTSYRDLAIGLQSVETFFEREVDAHVPDAWIDTSRRDEKSGEVGIVRYEINFNRYFYRYRYTPPRPLEEIEADIRGLETDIVRMLREVAG